MGVMSDAIETACGWAFVAIALYAMLFVNLTGNGTLWDSLRGVVSEAGPAPALANEGVRTRVVPVRPMEEIDVKTRAQNRMLLIPNEPEHEFKVPVLVQQSRGADQVTDAPADASAGKDWHMHLNGALRKFTVYGNGDERSSASSPAGSAQAASSAHSTAASAAPAAAADVSAFHAGGSAAARPGVSDHISPVDAGTGDGVRNFR